MIKNTPFSIFRVFNVGCRHHTDIRHQKSEIEGPLSILIDLGLIFVACRDAMHRVLVSRSNIIQLFDVLRAARRDASRLYIITYLKASIT
jgi:hypothetical protein